MPSTDSLRESRPPSPLSFLPRMTANHDGHTTPVPEPPLTPTERAICKSYGGWTNFMASMGLKPWDQEDADEGKAIIAAFAHDKEEEDKAKQDK